MNALGTLHVLTAIAAAPLLLGIINRVKAMFGGRTGQPLLQLYYDLFKLLRKGAVYSRTTTWLFRAGPMIGLAATIVALLLVPLGRTPAAASFAGDLILLAYLLGLMRFVTVLAALDTGSAFEGMGASREVQFAALAEPALLLALATMAAATKTLSLSSMFGSVAAGPAAGAAPAMLLVSLAVFIVLLAESSRIPFDDPNTHLELTMIHEVMVLDHGGVDLAIIEYAAALKLWLLSALLTGTVLAWLPWSPPDGIASLAAGLAGVAAIAVIVGLIESATARVRLVKVPHLLLAAGMMSLLALILVLR